jgi:OmpA-OmpF porin, OOP family
MSKASIRGFVLFAAAAASVCATGAWAQDKGLYVGLGVGQSEAVDYCDEEPGLVINSCDDSDTAYKIYAGYQFNRNFALEAAYNDWGEGTANVTALGITGDVDIKVKAFSLQAVGILPLGDRFQLFAKGGAVYWDLDIDASVSGLGTFSDSDSDFDFVAGVGAQVRVFRNLYLRGEFEYVPNLGNDDTGESDFQVWSVGLNFLF